MPFDLSKWGPATVLVVALVTIVVLVGGIVVITNPQTLNFETYLKVLAAAAASSGLLSIGRGHAAAADAVVTAAVVQAGGDLTGNTEGVPAASKLAEAKKDG